MPSKITPAVFGKCMRCFHSGKCHGFSIEKTKTGWECSACRNQRGKCKPVTQDYIDANIEKARKFVATRILQELRKNNPDLVDYKPQGKKLPPKFDAITSEVRDELRSLVNQRVSFVNIAKQLGFRGTTWWQTYARAYIYE